MLAAVQSHARVRGKAAEYFGDVAAVDPAWQILLRLFSSDLEGLQPNRDGLLAGSNCAETTMERCLIYLEGKGHVTTNSCDGPSTANNISLTQKARAALVQIFAEA